MGEVLPTLVILVLGLALFGAAQRPFTRRERGLLTLGFVMHVGAAIAQVLTTRYYYRGGDIFLYHSTGVELARLLRYDLSTFAPEVFALIAHRPVTLPIDVIGIGTTTGTMQGISAVLAYVLNDSIYAACMTLSVAAFFGQLALYRVFRETFHERWRTRLLAACILVPSVVFWTSGLLKEAVAVAAFGWTVLGIHRFVRGQHLRGLALVAATSPWIAMVKPYILFTLVIAGAVWWYWHRSSRVSPDGVVVRPVYLLMGAVGAVGAVVLLGEVFPRYSYEQVVSEAAHLQQVGTQVSGGSNYEIVDSPQRGLVGQLAFAPLALLTALFRPLIVEVRNVPMLVNALETSVLMLMFARSVWQRSWAELWNTFRRSPTLMFGLVFIVTFGTAVGLASTNLGTLSRYRVPLVPFFAATVLLFSGDATRRVSFRSRLRRVSRSK